MIRKYVLSLLAIAGICLAAYTVVKGGKHPPPAQPVAAPAEAPFDTYVAGAGLVESSTENIAIGTFVPGIVTRVYVRPGAEVKAGEPLFTIDDRAMRAELAVREASLATANGQLAKLLALPRVEEIPAAEARVKEAEANLGDMTSQLRIWESVTDKRAITEDELNRRRFAAKTAEARLAEARAALDLLKAGAFKPDIDVARAQVAAAQALVASIKTDIERLTVKAPVDGRVLQVKIRPGEFAQAGPLQEPLMLFGATARLHVRVDIDENDAWRIRPGSRAVVFVRGNNTLRSEARFERIEPFVVPKRSLTGASVERVDTRVLQVLFSFAGDTLPVYVGQQMDVFIEAPPVSPDARQSQPRAPSVVQ